MSGNDTASCPSLRSYEKHGYDGMGTSYELPPIHSHRSVSTSTSPANDREGVQSSAGSIPYTLISKPLAFILITPTIVQNGDNMHPERTLPPRGTSAKEKEEEDYCLFLGIIKRTIELSQFTDLSIIYWKEKENM